MTESDDDDTLYDKKRAKERRSKGDDAELASAAVNARKETLTEVVTVSGPRGAVERKGRKERGEEMENALCFALSCL